MRRLFALVVLLVAGISASPAGAERGLISGPIEVMVVRIIDGDTFVADARIWPGQTIRVNVRIRGIDAPEMKARCDEEATAAGLSRAELERLLQSDRVTISRIGGAKYYGRILADVAAGDERDLADAMLRAGLARPYAGGRRQNPCL